MGLQTYALSIHHFISSVGADAGFAAIIGLAILVLLYFAQARETSSLREQAELADQRIAQLESRLARAVSAQPQPQSQPQPPIAQPPSSVIGAVTVRPGPTFAAASNHSPPAGVAAPPLSAATKLIPTPPMQEPVIGAPGVAAARISAPASRAPVGAPMPGAPIAAAATAGAQTAGAPMAGAPTASAPTAGAPTAGAPTIGAPTAGAQTTGAYPSMPAASAPPVNRIVTPRPATAAGGATATNGTGERPVATATPPPAPPVPPRLAAGGPPILVGDYGDGGKRSGRRFDITRVLTAIAAVAVVAAIVVVLLEATSGGTPRTTPPTSGPVSNAPTTTTSHHRAKPRTPAVKPASVTVSVLNGTAVYHLADSVATQPSAAGFKSGTVANAATQTQPTTTVEYVPGEEREAAAVQKALKLGASSVQPITSDTQTLGCAQNPSACNVVVTVGGDLASSGTQTTG